MAETEELKRKELPLPESRYVRVEQISQLFGVTVRRVQQLTQEGILHSEKVREFGKTVTRYDFMANTQDYIQYLSDKAHGKNKYSDREMELKQQKLEADIALKESQGELHRIKTDIAAGKYISIDEVTMDYSKFFMVFKKFALSFPARLVGMLPASVEPVEARRIEKSLAAETNTLIKSFVVAGVDPDQVDEKKTKTKAKKVTADEEV